jgi:hypothetical protein
MESTDELLKTNTKDNKVYLIEYIQKIFNEIQNVDDSIELDYLNELVQTYYSRSLLTESEREERELVE